MSPGRLEARRAAHNSLSAQLTALDDAALSPLLLDGAEAEAMSGWGKSRSIDFGGTAVFAKRIPVTDAERRHPMSTKNRFRLPTYYSYGVGSAGFGAFRELDAHLKTTAWVLEGRAAGFPMLFHHRLVETPHATAARATNDDYVRYWNNSRAVGSFMAARAAARTELWLFLEHVPHTMWQWLPRNQSRIDDVIAQLFDAISILRANGIVHFDAHFGNVVTDGDHVFLTDFGLLLDESFELNASERAFLHRHQHYDYGEVIWAAGYELLTMYDVLPDDEKEVLRPRLGVDSSADRHTVLLALLDNIDQLDAATSLTVAHEFKGALHRYRHVIDHMGAFLTKMRSPKKNAHYDDDRMARLLQDAGAPIPDR